mgnify:CR=1 FL=1
MKLSIYEDELKLDAELCLPKDYEEGSRIPICLIIHGFTGNKDERHLIAVSDAMNEMGIATLRADMYGHGCSDGSFRRHTLFKWIENALTLIDHIKKDPRFGDLYLCGHSQGGLTAALAAKMEEEKLKALILLSPAFVIPEDARNGNLLGVRFDTKDLPADCKAKEGWILGENYIRVARMIHVEESIRGFEKPVLVVHGDEDRSIPIEPVKKMAEEYTDCCFATIPGESHCYDHHLDQVVVNVKSFLKSKR